MQLWLWALLKKWLLRTVSGVAFISNLVLYGNFIWLLGESRRNTVGRREEPDYW